VAPDADTGRAAMTFPYVAVRQQAEAAPDCAPAAIPAAASRRTRVPTCMPSPNEGALRSRSNRMADAARVEGLAASAPPWIFSPERAVKGPREGDERPTTGGWRDPVSPDKDGFQSREALIPCLKGPTAIAAAAVATFLVAAVIVVIVILRNGRNRAVITPRAPGSPYASQPDVTVHRDAGRRGCPGARRQDRQCKTSAPAHWPVQSRHRLCRAGRGGTQPTFTADFGSRRTRTKVAEAEEVRL
jgi:hypothetical protein